MGHGRAPAATQPGAVGSHHHPRATNPVCHHLATLPGRCQGWRWPLVAVPSPTLPHHPSPAVPRLVPRAQVGNARQVAAWHSSGASGSPWLTLSSLSARRVPTLSPHSTVLPRRHHGHLLAPRALGAEGKSRSRLALVVFRGWVGAQRWGGVTAAAPGVASPQLPVHFLVLRPPRFWAPSQPECSGLSGFCLPG